MKSLVLLIFVLTVSFCSTSLALNVSTLKCQSNDSLKILEKVYLHTDRDNYFPGDDIWFKAYIIDANDRTLTDNSKNLHVELISPDSKIISFRVIKLEDGLGNGDFKISENLKSGRYVLRAYTNYMRNYGDQLIFSKFITIYSLPDAARKLSQGSQKNINGFDISFFPEGGSLTDSVPCIVAFKSENQTGKGCDVSGEVYSADGNIVTMFRSTHNGMGMFSFVPITGINYYAIARSINGDTIRASLPVSFPEGVALNVYRDKHNNLVTTFKTNKKTLALIRDNDLVLTASAHEIEYLSLKIRIDSTDNFIVLPTENLPAGIYSLTLKSPASGPLCERLIYKGNNDQVKLSLTTHKKLYNQRDSVSLKISLSDNTQLFGEAFLSLSSTRVISSGADLGNSSSISSWFLLESEVRGPIEDPAWYFDPSISDRLKNLDLLLLTQGWRDFKWKYENHEYLSENGFSISGRLRKKFIDEPFKNSIINIGIFQEGKPLILTVPTDSTGKFCLAGIDLTGKAKIIASAAGENNRLHGLLILDSARYIPAKIPAYRSQYMLSSRNKSQFADSLSFFDSQEIHTRNVYQQYAEIKKSISRKYKLSDTINPGEVTITARQIDNPESVPARTRHYLYGSPDKSIIVTPQMESYGNVAQLLSRNMIFTSDMNRVIFVIDGVKVSGQMFMLMPVTSIARVDVLNTQASISIFGPNTEYVSSQTKPADGVISVTTRSEGFFNSYKVLLHSAKTDISGYDEPRIFYSPKHHTSLQSDYKPDLRTTLFWEPDIRMENHKETVLNYYNADNPALVRVTVEGITSDGIPVTGKLEYEVK